MNYHTYLLAEHSALGFTNKLASAVFAEFNISVLAAPVKYRTNLVERNNDILNSPNILAFTAYFVTETLELIYFYLLLKCLNFLEIES